MSRSSAWWVLAIVVAVVGWSSVYVVNEYDQVLLTQFGKLVSAPLRQPGLHFKVPFTQTVHRFDKRWMEWDGAPNEIPTRDKKYIWVDSYARWRIIDPVRFYERFRDERGAQSRLDDIIDGEIRNVIANYDLIEVVRTSSRPFEKGEDPEDASEDFVELKPQFGREALMRVVLEKAAAIMPEYGVELADIKLKRINYVASVQDKVFERMISERRRIAERYRSEGQGKSSEIRGFIEREQRTIQSEAYRQAAEIRGKADAEAAALYANAYNRDADFYQFVQTLQTYRQIIDGQTELVLSTNSELFKYLRAP